LNQHFRQRPFQPGNPLANILVVIAGIVVISLSLTLGFFIFLGVATFLLITAAIVSVRNWWFRRTLNTKSTANRRRQTGDQETRQIIEGEFREIRGVHEDRDKP
jgi:membrane protein implicated in regulation of membrane protease activity